MKKLLTVFVTLFATANIFNSFALADTATGTNFSLSKESNTSIVSTSSTVSYSITITNTSDTNQSPTQVTDTLPAGFTFANDAKLTNASGTQSDFTPTVSGQTLTWTFDGTSVQSLEPDDNIVISFTAATPASAGTYTNQACLVQPENICAVKTITVQVGTPNAGLSDNIIVGLAVGSVALGFGLRFRRKKLSFEEAILRRQ